MSGHDVVMMPESARVEVFTASHRRRRWSADQKARIVAESFSTSVGEASARHGVSKAQLFNWRREARADQAGLALARIELEPQSQTPVVGAATMIEIAAGVVLVRIGAGADPRLVTAIVGALKASDR